MGRFLSTRLLFDYVEIGNYNMTLITEIKMYITTNKFMVKLFANNILTYGHQGIKWAITSAILCVDIKDRDI